MPSFTVLLIDDHAMLRTGLALVIRSAMPEAFVLEAASFDEAMGMGAERVAAVLLDIQLPGVGGLDCIAPIRRKWPGSKVVMVSSQDDPQSVRLAQARGASEFVSKSESAARIVDAIRAVLAIEPVPGTAASNALQARKPTPRQREVLDLLYRGLSNKVIARQLNLSDNTVRRHVQDLLEFFKVGSRAEAVFAARRQGMVD